MLAALVTGVSRNGEKRKSALKLCRWVRSLTSTFLHQRFQAAFPKAELLANTSPRETKRHVLLLGTQCWKIWEFRLKTPTFHAGLGAFASSFHISVFLCYCYTHPGHANPGVRHQRASRVLLQDTAWNQTIFFSPCPPCLHLPQGRPTPEDAPSRAPSCTAAVPWLRLPLGYGQTAPRGTPHWKDDAL